jgi:hypothetical protein
MPMVATVMAAERIDAGADCPPPGAIHEPEGERVRLAQPTTATSDQTFVVDLVAHRAVRIRSRAARSLDDPATELRVAVHVSRGTLDVVVPDDGILVPPASGRYAALHLRVAMPGAVRDHGGKVNARVAVAALLLVGCGGASPFYVSRNDAIRLCGDPPASYSTRTFEEQTVRGRTVGSVEIEGTTTLGARCTRTVPFDATTLIIPTPEPSRLPESPRRTCGATSPE